MLDNTVRLSRYCFSKQCFAAKLIIYARIPLALDARKSEVVVNVPGKRCSCARLLSCGGIAMWGMVGCIRAAESSYPTFFVIN